MFFQDCLAHMAQRIQDVQGLSQQRRDQYLPLQGLPIDHHVIQAAPILRVHNRTGKFSKIRILRFNKIYFH